MGNGNIAKRMSSNGNVTLERDPPGRSVGSHGLDGLTCSCNPSREETGFVLVCQLELFV